MDETNYMPMLGLAAGLLQGPQPGQQRGFGSSFSNGLLGGMQGMQMAREGADDKRRARLQDLQLQLQMVRAQKEQAQDAARQMAIGKLSEGASPDLQAMLQAAPDAAMAAMIEQRFAAPKPPTSRNLVQGGEEITQEWNGSEWVEVGRGGRWAPQQPTQGPETWNILDPEKAKALGLQGVWQVSNRNQFKALDSADGPDTEIGKYYAAMDAEQDPTRRAAYQAKIDGILKGRSGVKFTTAAGDVMEIGGEGGGTMDLTQPNLNDAQGKVIATGDQLARINNLGADFKKEYMQVGPRVNAGITAGMEKLGLEPSPEAQKELADITMFRSSVMNNTNQVIKEQSGLTMNESEAQRIQQEAPSDGDSPTEFMAKLAATKKRLTAVEIRKKLLLRQGIQFDAANPAMSLDDVPNAIDAEGERIERELVQQGRTQEQAEQEAAQQLKQLYGL
jgi:hypothetical protein